MGIMTMIMMIKIRQPWWSLMTIEHATTTFFSELLIMADNCGSSRYFSSKITSEWPGMSPNITSERGPCTAVKMPLILHGLDRQSGSTNAVMGNGWSLNGYWMMVIRRCWTIELCGYWMMDDACWCDMFSRMRFSHDTFHQNSAEQWCDWWISTPMFHYWHGCFSK